MTTHQQEHAPYTLRWAFRLLSVEQITTEEEVLSAFRRKVKQAADGVGNYHGDMDELKKAKEYVLLALQKSREQAIRDRARQLETEERRKQMIRKEKARREQQQVQEQPLEPPPPRSHKEYVAEEPEPQAKQQEQTETSQARDDSWEPTPTESEPEEHSRTSNVKEEGDVIQSAFRLLHQRQTELVQARQKEQELAQVLSATQTHRQALEQAVQSANTLARQIHTILETEAARHR